MSLVSNIKNISILTVVLFLFSACGGGGGSTSTSPTPQESNSLSITNEGYTTTSTASTDANVDLLEESSIMTPTIETPTAKAIHSGQVKDSSTGDGLANVTVSLGESTTTTDENGFYTLPDVITSEEAVINFEKEGYIMGSTTIQIKALSGDNSISSNYLEYTLETYRWKWSYESQIGTGGGAVEVPAGAIHIDETETVYNGVVYASFSYKDTMIDKGRDAFPGTFKGINTNGVLVPFVSYGFMSLELKNDNNASLNISENITLLFSSTSIKVTGTTQDTLPLWYYDYEQGLWVEEGYAERQEDGSYRADISHPGTWSLSQAIEEEVGIYRGHIVNEDGTPMSDVRLHAVGENWISSDLSTDADGMFEIEVIPGSSFQLKAYDYKNKYGANYNDTIAAIASGDVVEE